MAYINRPKKKQEKKEKTDKTKLIYDTVYNTTMWKNLRKSKMMIHPICERCLKNLATEVHHITPISTADTTEDMMKLGFDSSNLICLCSDCHKQVHRELKK